MRFGSCRAGGVRLVFKQIVLTRGKPVEVHGAHSSKTATGGSLFRGDPIKNQESDGNGPVPVQRFGLPPSSKRMA